MYIPAGASLNEIRQTLKEEYGTATNIKDKPTGKAVQDAISRVIAALPGAEAKGNGISVFCGKVNTNKMELFVIEPPEPISVKLYICDDHFHLDHLRDMLIEKDSYGIVVIDRSGADFAQLRGTNVKMIRHHDSYVPSKHGRGGQSQRRIERGIEILADEFFTKMAVETNNLFLEKYPVTGILIGGAAFAQERFAENKALNYQIKEKILVTFNLGYTGHQGIRELLEKSADALADVRLIQEKKLVDKFLEHLGKDTGMITYGITQLQEALEAGAVETVLLSTEVDRIEVELKCQTCDFAEARVSPGGNNYEFEEEVEGSDCPKCPNGRLTITNRTSLIDILAEKALLTGATIEVISTEHESGRMLSDAFSGIAAILRYAWTSSN
jgi:peptide chain release factor subunit 1